MRRPQALESLFRRRPCASKDPPRSAPWDPAWRPTGAGVFAVELASPTQLSVDGGFVKAGGPLLEAIAASAVRRIAGMSSDQDDPKRERGLAEVYGVLERCPSRDEIAALTAGAQITRDRLEWVTSLRSLFFPDLGRK